MKQKDKTTRRAASWVLVLLALACAVALAVCLKPREAREAAVGAVDTEPEQLPEPEPAAKDIVQIMAKTKSVERPGLFHSFFGDCHFRFQRV